MANITVSSVPPPPGGGSSTLVYGAALIVVAVTFAFTKHGPPSTGPMLPPTVILEAALDTDRLSSSTIVTFLRWVTLHYTFTTLFSPR